MKKLLSKPVITICKIIFFLLAGTVVSNADTPDSVASNSSLQNLSVLVLPYKPMMHLSDADYDIARYSDMNLQEMRNHLRTGLIQNLNAKLIMEYDAKIPEQDFVHNDARDMELIYSSVSYGEDTVYPLKKNALHDSLQWKKKNTIQGGEKAKPIQRSYINVYFFDQQLLPDLARQYNSDYFIFMNELDIKTHYDNCLDLALKIYQRELKVHYSIFDRKGKQVYGDVAIMHFPSNSNDVDEIIRNNFPGISDQILSSVAKFRPMSVQVTPIQTE